MADIAQQLADFDKRIRRLEQIVERHFTKPTSAGEKPASQPTPGSAQASPATPLPKGSPVTRPGSPAAGTGDGARAPVPVTQILGWSGAAALVLAAVYFIRLAIDAGWLTPERQVALAALGGAGLVVIGFVLRKANRGYASLLPAAGIVILFLTVFGAHIYYGLIDAPLASGCVIAICICALWLGRVFDNSLYVLFAVVGAYLTPFLIPVWHANLIDLVIYYSAWSLLFCVYAVWLGGRESYLLAMYLALVGFDLIWRTRAESQWMMTAVFQAVQFLIFVVAAAMYSVRHASPMTETQAWAHAPGLVIFYAVEYFILGSHLPEWAPWIAIASAAALLLIYQVARSLLRATADAGAFLCNSYAALVLFHAVYIDLIPFEWAPWFALGMLVALGTLAASGKALERSILPFGVAIGLMVAVSFMQLITGYKLANVPGPILLSLLFAGVLYLGYAMTNEEHPLGWMRIPLLYAGHVAAMLTISRMMDASLLVSVFWGFIAIGSLLLALAVRDKLLGQSSLLIFAVSGLKVLVYDLAGSPAPVRIGTLVVLGVTLYVGGWLYQKLATEDGGVDRARQTRVGAV